MDSLEAVIGLSIALRNNEIEKVKEDVNIINNDIDNLIQRFDIQDKDIGAYFSLYDIFSQVDNESVDYAIESLASLKENKKDKIKWYKKIKKLVTTKDMAQITSVLEDIFQLEKINDYQIEGIIRLINIVQKYKYFISLKERVEQI